MSIIDHGVWEKYTPEKPPEWVAQLPSTPLFSRNKDGVDWYEYRKTKVRNDTIKILLWPNTNQVFGANKDTSAIFPLNFRLIEIDRDLDYERDLMLRYFDDKTETFMERQ